ncbi:MAG: co-chaperone GroES [bacterium]
MSKIKPLGDRIVVKPAPQEEVLKSGIVIPDTASKERQDQGTVVATGPGKFLENGKRSEMSVKEGDRILFSKYGPTEVKIGGEDLLILREEDILGILE